MGLRVDIWGHVGTGYIAWKGNLGKLNAWLTALLNFNKSVFVLWVWVITEGGDSETFTKGPCIQIDILWP